MNSEDLYVAFQEMSIQLIEASVAAWPEDPLLPIALVKVKEMDHMQPLALFEEAFGPIVDSLAQKDLKALHVVAEHPQLQALCIEQKFLEASASTQKTLWNYISNLCRFASMRKLYTHIPSDVLGAVQEAASSLKKQIDDGSLDTSSINPYELGQQVMSKFKPEDMERMMKDIMKNPEVVSSMMSQMQGLMGNVSDPNSATLDLSALQGFMK
jgi:hypothetical protein